MTITKILSGHYSEETSHLVEDYPYGFKLRCKIRYWLEVNNKGTRFWSQTTNPKRGDIWNKAKASTYYVVGAMYLDEQGYVQWSGFSEYDASKAREWLNTFREGITEKQATFLERLADAYDRHEAKKKEGTAPTWKIEVIDLKPITNL
jgi:hypothetical protein